MYDLYRWKTVDEYRFSPIAYPENTNWKLCLDALSWSTGNPGYSYSKLLPNLKFTDKEIYEYLQHLKEEVNYYYSMSGKNNS